MLDDIERTDQVTVWLTTLPRTAGAEAGAGKGIQIKLVLCTRR